MEIFDDAQSDISESSPIRQMAASVSWTEIPRNRENAGFGGRHFVEYFISILSSSTGNGFFEIPLLK